MCRLIAFSNFYKRTDYIDIALDFEAGNEDGFGYGYIKDGEIIVHKWKRSLSKVMRKHGKEVFSHLKDDKFTGITVAHVRAASCGIVSKANSHPFIVGNNICCHNGHWWDSELVRLAMGKSVKYTSDTDSEVAFNLVNKIGMKRFVREVPYGGVFMMLNKSGYLHIGKVSGDLCFQKMEDDSFLIASELDDDEFEDQIEAENGYYCFNPSGHLIQKIDKFKSLKTIDCSGLADREDNLSPNERRTIVFNHPVSQQNSAPFYHKDEVDHWEDRHKVTSFRI